MAGEIAVIKGYMASRHKDANEIVRLFREAHRYTGGNSYFLIKPPIFSNEEPSLLGGFFGFYGHLKIKADLMGRDLDSEMGKYNIPYSFNGYIPVCQAEFYYEQNHLDRAVKALVRGMAEANDAENPGALVPGWFTLAKIYRAQGSLEEAVRVVTEGEKNILQLNQPQWLPVLAALKTRLYLEQGDGEAVERWQRDNSLIMHHRPSAAGEYGQITLARVLMAKQRWDEALLLLTALEAFAEGEKRLAGSIEIANLLAIGWQAKGETGKALEALGKSLALGEENGYLRRFIDEGMPMLELLGRYSRERSKQETDSTGSVSPQYVRELIRLAKKDATVRGIRQPAVQPGSNGLSPGQWLTRREIQVLRMMALELTNAEIAERLSLKLSTVKYHSFNIYGKLDVRNRTQAVARGRELGVI